MDYTDTYISSYIKELKAKCAIWGMDKNVVPHSEIILTNDQLKEKKQEYTDLLEIFHYFTEKTTMFQLNIPVFIILNDRNGYLLDLYGEPLIKQTMETLGITTGIKLTEEDNGVNTVTLCLKHRCPIQCIGDDHYHTFLHQSACYSAPIFSATHNGEVVGCLSIMTTSNNANPLLLTLLSTICDSFTRELKVKHQNTTLDALNRILSAKSKNGMIIFDTKGIIMKMNPAAEHVTGLKSEELVGNSISLLGGLAPYINDTLTKGSLFNDIEYTFINENEQTNRVCLFDVFPVYNEKQELVRVVFQCRDLTEYRQLEERVFRLDKLSLVGQLAAGVAHEIRNPLSSVKGFVQLLFEDPERYMKYKELVLNEIQRIEKLVSDFLLVTRPTHPNKQMVNLHDLMTDTIEFLNSECMLHDILIVYQISNMEQYISVDPNQIKQVLLNLIKNAIEAIGSHGTIQVIVKEIDAAIMITIQDNGPGIQEHILKNIQDPFFSTKENGTGLGLSVCNQIIEAHGGILEITSIPSVNTTVTITIPSVEYYVKPVKVIKEN